MGTHQIEPAQQARKLYVEDGATIESIANTLGYSKQTVYRWRAESAGKWDEDRTVFVMAPREMFSLYAHSVKKWIVSIKNNPEQLADTRMADAMVKHIKALKELDPKTQTFGIILDLIKEIDAYLREHSPELQSQMLLHWDGIKERLQRYGIV